MWDFGTFKLEKLPDVFAVCEPGNVYSIQQSRAAVYAVSGSTVDTAFIPSDSNLSGEWNGLGIGDQGRAIYAFKRVSESWPNSRNGFEINRYDSDTGKWATLATEYYSSARSNNRVAGAVDLLTGEYYFGGFDTGSTNNPFRMWKYSPTTGNVTYVGM